MRPYVAFGIYVVSAVIVALKKMGNFTKATEGVKHGFLSPSSSSGFSCAGIG